MVFLYNNKRCTSVCVFCGPDGRMNTIIPVKKCNRLCPVILLYSHLVVLKSKQLSRFTELEKISHEIDIC